MHDFRGGRDYIFYMFRFETVYYRSYYLRCRAIK